VLTRPGRDHSPYCGCSSGTFVQLLPCSAIGKTRRCVVVNGSHVVSRCAHVSTAHMHLWIISVDVLHTFSEHSTSDHNNFHFYIFFAAAEALLS